MELIELYDIHRQHTGLVTTRGLKLAAGMYRIVVHVCVFNSKGEMLIQQRQLDKKVFPGKWDISAGGQVMKGETSQQAAQRELSEELSLMVNLENVRPRITMNFDDGFDDIYVVESDARIAELTIQGNEVKAVDWADEETILRLINKGEFIPYHPAYISLLFTLRDTTGSFVRNGMWNDTESPLGTNEIIVVGARAVTKAEADEKAKEESEDKTEAEASADPENNNENTEIKAEEKTKEKVKMRN